MKPEYTKLIKLDNEVGVLVPLHFNYAKCKCGADDIVWGTTEKNKRPIPIRWDEIKGWITHFTDCPFANEFRKKK